MEDEFQNKINFVDITTSKCKQTHKRQLKKPRDSHIIIPNNSY